MGISTRTWREQRLFLEQSQSRRSRRNPSVNVSGENGHDAPSREQQQAIHEAALEHRRPQSLSSTATHTIQHPLQYIRIRLLHRPFLVSHTSILDPPRSWCATEKQHSFCRRPQTQPARAHHDYDHDPRPPSIPLIPCPLRLEGQRPGLANIAARADIPETLHGHGCTGRCASQRVALCQ